MKKPAKAIYTLISIASLTSFILVWWLFTDVLKMTEPYLLPSPLKVFSSLINKLYNPNPDGGVLFEHIAASLTVTLSGLTLGVMAGIPVGVLMAWFPKFDRFFRPVFDFVRPIPTIAWIPLMILWFGIGLLPKILLIFIGTFIASVLNAYAGMKTVNPVHLWVAQTFGAKRSQMLFQIAIPTALPYFFTALRVALNIAWMSLVAAELLAATKGLGYMIQFNRTMGRVDNVIVGMLVIGAIGALFSWLLELIEKHFIKGRVR